MEHKDHETLVCITQSENKIVQERAGEKSCLVVLGSKDT